MTTLEPFLRATTIINWEQPEVLAVARELAHGRAGQVDLARTCFEWVRDEVPHTSDYHRDPVTCSASEVLMEKTGFCYAKSHLLAALLRANGVPVGFVYQRLALDDRGTAFCLHGLNAIWLPQVGWYRIDPRGNREDLRAAFDPPREALPFTSALSGERLFPGIWAEPLPIVVDALQRHRTRAALEANMPDATGLELQPEATEFIECNRTV